MPEIAEETWKRLAGEGRLDDAVEEYVRGLDWVSFADLQRQFDAYMNTRGTFTSASDKYENLIFWTGMSEEFCEIVTRLNREGRVRFEAGSWMSYMIDGGGLELPTARRIRGYKERHWLPTFLRPPREHRP